MEITLLGISAALSSRRGILYSIVLIGHVGWTCKDQRKKKSRSIEGGVCREVVGRNIIRHREHYLGGRGA